MNFFFRFRQRSMRCRIQEKRTCTNTEKIYIKKKKCVYIYFYLRWVTHDPLLNAIHTSRTKIINHQCKFLKINIFTIYPILFQCLKESFHDGQVIFWNLIILGEHFECDLTCSVHGSENIHIQHTYGKNNNVHSYGLYGLILLVWRHSYVPASLFKLIIKTDNNGVIGIWWARKPTLPFAFLSIFRYSMKNFLPWAGFKLKVFKKLLKEYIVTA